MRILCKGAEVDVQHEQPLLPGQVASSRIQTGSKAMAESVQGRAWGSRHAGIDSRGEK